MLKPSQKQKMNSDSDSSSSSSTSFSSTSSSYLSQPVDEYHDLPHDSTPDDGNKTESEKKNDDADGLNSLCISTTKLEQGPPSGDCLNDGDDETACDIDITSGCQSGCCDVVPQVLADDQSSPSNFTPSAIPHRGSLRRILNLSSFHAIQNNSMLALKNPRSTPSSWPVYAINIAAEDFSSHHSHTNAPENNDCIRKLQPQKCYQIVFDRQQYEFCTRLFAILDTQSQYVVSPNCINEFVTLHCPVVRIRDEAIFAMRSSDVANEAFSSPTFLEIWERTINSDPRRLRTPANGPAPTVDRIGIEGWMVFCRLLALAHHQESQRRFASRHLQQMMRHKHGTTRMSSNEVVVVVDNPPPGPPSSISICDLAQVERERVASNSSACIEGWPFCPLPLPELDLDHRFASVPNSQNTPGLQVSVKPFSTSREDDFILRYRNNASGVVVRRSYKDFQWLDAILKLHKRPGQGHLCGRILPPFPSNTADVHQQRHIVSKETVRRSRPCHHNRQDISERAISAAKSGMGMISSMAMSVWSGYVSASVPSSKLSKNSLVSSPKKSSLAKEEDFPTIVGQRMERYLNYLLENTAFSTSFPLSAILQASQTGLESAKQTLQDHAKEKKRQRSSSACTTLKGGSHSAASIFSALVSKPSTSCLRLDDDSDTPWLRAAAQAAMALQFHGILETTGHETTSAKLQHASLPKFYNCPTASWDEEEAGGKRAGISRHIGSDSLLSETNFEAGVVNVESELAEEDFSGFDMLPSPGPSDEHRVLNAGNFAAGKLCPSPKCYTFVYETNTDHSDAIQDRKGAVLGSIRVERDIDKLRDIVRSINYTLAKLHQSSISVQSSQGARSMIELSLLRDVDSWGDTGSEVISQRALVDGVAALEAYKNAVEESNTAMTNDFLWQSSLASSAVSAVREVRDAVKASHTASRAKSAAFVAAQKAKKAYESCDHSSSKEKVQRTRAEASMTQGHAIHAAVVEYEADIAKKRSALSLAQDIKSWNVHRKRELLRTCVQVAKSQQEACKRAADAWERLQDGLIDLPYCYGEDTTNASIVLTPPSHANVEEIPEKNGIPQVDVSGDRGLDYNNLDPTTLANSSNLHEWEIGQEDFPECIATGLNSMPSARGKFSEVCSLKDDEESQHSLLSSGDLSGDVYCLQAQSSCLDEDYFSFQRGITEKGISGNEVNEDHHTSYTHESFHSGQESVSVGTLGANADMSTSMQSLIDGLIAWGGEESHT